MIALPPGMPHTLDIEHGAAQYRLDLHLAGLPDEVGSMLVDGLVLRATASALHRVLLSTATEVLSSSLLPTDPGFVSVRLALGHLVSGLLGAESAVAAGRRLRPALWKERADAAIATRAADSDFGVAVLAQDLGISPDYLFKIYRAFRTTPGREIRDARIALARAYGAAGPAAHSLPELARLAGFRNEQALRRARRAATTAPAPRSVEK